MAFLWVGSFPTPCLGQHVAEKIDHGGDAVREERFAGYDEYDRHKYQHDAYRKARCQRLAEHSHTYYDCREGLKRAHYGGWR